MAGGFLKLSTDAKVDELMEANPHAFLLVTQIARRARRTSGGINRHNLEIGEALIGDFSSIGLTEQTYRTAKSQLAEWKIATFKPTTKGTVAKLTDTSIYDINAETANGRATDVQRTTNGRLTTNEEGEEGKKGKKPPSGVQGVGKEKKNVTPSSSEALRVAALFNRRPTTRWDEKEIARFLKIRDLVTDEHLTLLEAYYTAQKAMGADGHQRRGLMTLLNNFTEEVDRARGFQDAATRVKSRQPSNPNLVGMRMASLPPS